MAKGSRRGKNGGGGAPDFKPIDLPDMQGSEKQIAWAKSIVAKAYQQVQRNYEDETKLAEDIKKKYGSQANKYGLTKSEVKIVAENAKQALDKGFSVLGAKASTVINERDNLSVIGRRSFEKAMSEYKQKKAGK